MLRILAMQGFFRRPVHIIEGVAGVLAEFYREGLSNAAPLSGVSISLAHLQESFEIHIVTARDSECSQLTGKWLSHYQIPYDALHS